MIIKKLKQFLIELGDASYYKKIEKELTSMDSVLDLGCGSCSPLAKVKKNFYSQGLDSHGPSIEKSRRAKIHDKYKKSDVRKVDKFYQPKSFDAVLALDLIEHLTKKEALDLIDKMERIAKKKVILFTPQGFLKQDASGENPSQVHQSGWSIKELKKLGYQCWGMRGLKFIRGEWATIKYKPWFFWGMLSVLSQFFVYYFPRFAFQLLAVKELKPNQ